MEETFKIFLVDDDLFSLSYNQHELQNLGFKDISLFMNGTVCLNNLHLKPDVIFLDHNMDTMTGFEVLKKIKRYDPNINVVILSGQETIKTAVDALKYGAFDYIMKGDDEIVKMKDSIARILNIRLEIQKANPTFIQKLLSIF